MQKEEIYAKLPKYLVANFIQIQQNLELEEVGAAAPPCLLLLSSTPPHSIKGYFFGLIKNQRHH